METAVKLYDRDCENFAPPRNRAEYGMENVLAALETDALAGPQRDARSSQPRGPAQDHQTGGVGLGLVMLTGVIGHDLATHIEKERERERTTWQRLDRGLRTMGDNLRALSDLDADRGA